MDKHKSVNCHQISVLWYWVVYHVIMLSFPIGMSSRIVAECILWLVIKTQRDNGHIPVVQVNRHGWHVCTLSSFTPVLRSWCQDNGMLLSCCRLVTLVTVAVQQDPASLTPEARLISKPAEVPWVNVASRLFSVLFMLRHLLPEIHTKKLTPSLKSPPPLRLCTNVVTQGDGD